MKEKKTLSPQPLVSVIIPTFNRRQWIGECLDSVLKQTYRNVEIIVVDDCSSDGTAEWIGSQPQYSSVRVHVQAKNGGASIARNTGIEISKGEFIAFIDSDDLLLPQHCETAVAAFEKYPNLGLFCCDSTMIDAAGSVLFDGKTWNQTLSEIKKYPIKTGIRPLEDVFMFLNCFPGFTLRREVFEKLGGFVQEIFPADDCDLMLRVAGSRYEVFYFHEPLCLRREHDGQCSGVENSVKTCQKLIEALNGAIRRNPEILKNKAEINKRMAEITLDLGMSQMKEGKSSAGLKTIFQSVASSPQQFGTLMQIGKRKLKHLSKLK
ncbi:MAG TPA: glycosyltransferase family A protein [Pyrinomonadaceae bacterium]|nr:glycosyltransferase family A protein [Pyrinomonadaceae bacterium]